MAVESEPGGKKRDRWTSQVLLTDIIIPFRVRIDFRRLWFLNTSLVSLGHPVI